MSNKIHGRLGGLKSTILGTASTAALLLLAGGAHAQAPAKDADVEEVVVTGSRISIPGFQSPTPITSISAQDLQVKAIGQVQDLFNDIPQLAPFTGSSTGSQNVNQASFNLRGVGSTRTLVMLEGRRFAPTQYTGGVDSGVFPTSVIRSVSVVTGGASAAYGSDAVAGVVNVELDDKFIGFKAGLNGGGTPHMDSFDLGGYAQAGTAFSGGRGHIMIAGEAFNNSGFYAGARSWGRQGTAVLANPACTGTPIVCPAGQYKNVWTNDVSLSRTSDGGVITAGPLKNIQFGPGGVVEKFNQGTLVGTTFMSGGDGTNEEFHSNYSDTFYTSQNDRTSRADAFTQIAYDITPDISVWADGLYAAQKNSYWVIPNYNIGDITVTRQNAFLPTAVAALMDSNKITSFLMGRANEEMGWNYSGQMNNSQQYSFGVDGKLGGWSYHAFAQFSANRYYQTQGNNRKEQDWKNSIDSILNPAAASAGITPVAGVAAGTPVCRLDTLTATVYSITNAAGCVPVDLFGMQGHGSGPIPQFTNGGDTTWSPALVNYVEGTSFSDSTNVENDFAINVTGSPFDIWAGPVSVAFGIEHRFDGINGKSDPLSLASGWRQVNFQPVFGKIKVTEGYVETEVPLLKNAPWAEDLNINAAGRITDYSTSGMVETWKVGLNWTPVDDIRFRATNSLDIRAPNTNELYQAGIMNNSSITDPRSNLQQQSPILTTGNKNLLPETGRTITAGAVYSPSWLDGFTMSADWYQLHITGAISNLSVQQVLDYCFGTAATPQQVSYCSQVTLDPAQSVPTGSGTGPKIVKVITGPFNSQAQQTDGWDFEASYSTPTDDLLPFLGFGGDLRLHALASWTRVLQTYSQGNVNEGAGRNLPHWRWNATATWTSNPYTVSVDGRWIGNTSLRNYIEGIDIAPGGNKVDGRFTVNATFEYQYSQGVSFYGRVRNVFDVDPPLTPGTLNIVHAVGGTTYDVVGRKLQMGVRLSY